MNQTTNLHLDKPSLTDFVDIEVLNTNFDKIDTAVTDAKANIVRTKSDIASSTKVIEVILLANRWSGSAPFLQSVTIAEITSQSQPVGSPKIPRGASKEYKKACECIDGFETNNGAVTFYCNRKCPSENITVLLKGV
ncbi:MAG: hypothetical protein HXM41_03630 [Lachnospiraceae bacterium]|nr:hypothetical protein [Lachnospiraceae bacterium]